MKLKNEEATYDKEKMFFDFVSPEFGFQKGDTITSKKGMLMKGAFTGTKYLVFSATYQGDGGWLVNKKLTFKE